MTDYFTVSYFTGKVTEIVTSINFYDFILPLIIYTMLIAAYGIIVWTFYKSISKRDLFRMDIHDGKWWHKAGYILKYLILFPILVFMWFAALSIILFFLSKSQSTETILLISMAMVAAARIASYYKEEPAQEIAKILPLAVLGIFVVDPTFFSFQLTYSRFGEVTGMYILLANYLLFTIVLEFVLRILLAIKRKASSYGSKTKPIKPTKAAKK